MATAFSRQAQYSSTAPWPVKAVGSQKPLYSENWRVRCDVRGWKPVSRVSRGSASGVMRKATALEKTFFSG